MPKAWQAAFEKFLATWPHRKDVTAAVACGSFITGNPSPRSDLDVHLVLKPSVKWRERGNRIIDGIMIEYFANPPAQIRKYFKENYAGFNQTNATMFVTGRILFDQRGDARRLKREAQRWLKKRFPTRPLWRCSLDRYALFDHYDNVLDAIEHRSPDADYRYFSWLALVYDLYARALFHPVQTAKNTLQILTSVSAQQKYAASPFPDRKFVRLFAAAVSAQSSQKRKCAERLYQHVRREMGGFEIDGWRMRTPVDV